MFRVFALTANAIVVYAFEPSPVTLLNCLVIGFIVGLMVAEWVNEKVKV